MKIFHKIWLGATLCAVCACSQSEGLLEESETGIGHTNAGSDTTRELMLEFDNTLQL